MSIVVGSNTLSGEDSLKRTYSVKKVFPHENYIFESVSDDIGLVQLNDKIEFNHKVNRIKLAFEKDLGKANYKAVASGWGGPKVKKYFKKLSYTLNSDLLSVFR